MEIQLRQGIKFDDPQKVIISYWEREWGFRDYDKTRLPENNSFTEEQIRLVIQASNKLKARIPYKNEDKVIKPILQKKNEIESELALIPNDVNILDDYEKIPWEYVKSLLNIFSIKYLGLARKTKILHKKRPNIIPILDSILESRYCVPILKAKNLYAIEEAERAINCIKELKEDIDMNRDTLLNLQQSLESKDYGIYDTSILRLLDILIWSHFKRSKA